MKFGMIYYKYPKFLYIHMSERKLEELAKEGLEAFLEANIEEGNYWSFDGKQSLPEDIR